MMEYFGVTIKELREKRGFQIKEVYSGVVGRSTAFRFERGTTNISTKKLLEVLYNIGIYSMDEFLFFHQKRINEPSKDLDKYLAQLMHKEGLNIKSKKHDQVLGFYEEFKNSKKKEEKFLAYAAHFDYLTNQEENMGKNIPIAEILKEYQDQWEYIENYLLEIESWSFRELDWFPFLSSCFHKENRPLLLARFKKNFKELRDYYENWERHYINNLINYLMNSVYMGYYDELEKDISEIDKYFEIYSELQWELSQRCRILYIKIIIAGKERRMDIIRKNYEQLSKISNVLPKNNELMDFYLEDSLRKVKEIFPDLDVAKVLK